MGERPVPGLDYPRTIIEFQEWFASDLDCYNFLADLRWPDGFVCPGCGVHEAFWRTSDALWMCRVCSRQTSVTAGTIFDRTRSPLRMWFFAAWYVVGQKNGVSAQGLQRVIGLRSYETAWAWMHKFRRVMVDPDRTLLSGTVELDITYVGGISHGPGKTGKGSDKVPVMVATEMLTQRKIGRTRMAVSPSGTGKDHEAIDWLQEVAEPGITVKTDGAVAFAHRLPKLGYTHKRYIGMGSEEPAHENLWGVHMVASQFKRYLIGTLHLGNSEELLPRYLDEFVFRFNRRGSNSRGLLFYRLMELAVRTEPQPLGTLHIPYDE